MRLTLWPSPRSRELGTRQLRQDPQPWDEVGGWAKLSWPGHWGPSCRAHLPTITTCDVKPQEQGKKTTQSSVTHILIALTHTHIHKYSDMLDRFVCELKTPRHARGLMDSTNIHTCTQSPALPRHALGRSPDFRIGLERE